MNKLLQKVKEASFELATLSNEQKNQALIRFAELLNEKSDFLLKENAKDLKTQKKKISVPLYQRLKLDKNKLDQLALGINDIVNMTNPVGRIMDRTQMDGGLILEKVSVPVGVIAIVFESRPDVIPQILSLALKSGNAVVLKGGKEAKCSNEAILKLVDQLNKEFKFLPRHWAVLLDSREAFRKILAYPQYIDLVIPRGSNALVRKIMDSTKIPVMGHAEGICHQYVHESADIEKAVKIVLDSKKQYPAACNALETLLVDQSIAAEFLPAFEAGAGDIELKACKNSRKILRKSKPATDKDWATEYLSLTLSVKTVKNLEEAIAHINLYGSHHTDGIITEDSGVQDRFLEAVNSASVMVNASTRFADGYRFGLGAEVGISTATTHARGPVGLEGLTIYKYLLKGSGQIVADYVGDGARKFMHKKL